MRHRLMAAATLVALVAIPLRFESAAAHRELLIVLDGLRPDYVTPAVMPTLYAFGQRGIVFTNHHSVFPTVTRVNASSIVSGSYPGTHGLMGNTVFFPQVEPRRFLNTENRADMERVQAATGGHLLTAPTLGGLLQNAGMKLLVVSAGSGGASYLLNDKLSGGAIINVEYTLPESLHPKVVAAVGAAAPDSLSSGEKNRRTVDAFFRVGLSEIDPSVTVMWLTDPDTTAHEKGIGHPETVAALKALDLELKRVLDGLAERKLTDTWNVWVTSDHGFATSIGGPDINKILQPHMGTLPDGTPRIVTSGGAIYVRDHNQQTIDTIARTLQTTPGIGAIFMPAARPGAVEGRVAGTMSYESIRWAHDRSADILYAAEWTDAVNAYGFKGASTVNGVATHGNSSPYEIHNTLIAVGPDLKSQTTVNTPSGNVDFAPTFLAMLGLPTPPTMQGRVLNEALRHPTTSAPVTTAQNEQTVASADKKYTLTAHYSTVRSGATEYRYFDWTRVARR